ncbi:hypothetical protein Hamer_G020981 [Homarus americanus]|uniref:Uncharacterized protein n=1 Tax=Homarus americanus TaxID=6706 RepID=A0A8J5N8Y3_HOMAM|nr:hypothetical protein Hamer_G020981 [Homarus americanus]
MREYLCFNISINDTTWLWWERRSILKPERAVVGLMQVGPGRYHPGRPRSPPPCRFEIRHTSSVQHSSLQGAPTLHSCCSSSKLPSSQST